MGNHPRGPFDVDEPETSPKQFVRDILEHMPDNATLAEIIDQIRLEAALEVSERDIREGRVIPDAEVKSRMRQKLEGRK